MSAWVVLGLDTTAPEVEWGAPTGVKAGETLVVPYTSDGAIATATLVADSEYAMTVYPDRLEVSLPGDLVAGPATVVARDDVDNAAELELQLYSLVVLLELDTTAPEVEWGTPTGTFAGELFSLPYSTNEPIASAELIDAGGVHRPLTVYPDHLELLLPGGTYDGLATVVARDDVDNGATLQVLLHGVAVPPPPTPAPTPSTPGFPAGPRTRRAPIHRFRSATRVRSRASVAHRGRRTTVTTSRSAISRRPSPVPPTGQAPAPARDHAARFRSQTGIRTDVRVRSTGHARSVVRVRSSAAIDRRSGPELEAAFILDL